MTAAAPEIPGSGRAMPPGPTLPVSAPVHGPVHPCGEQGARAVDGPQGVSFVRLGLVGGLARTAGRAGTKRRHPHVRPVHLI